MIPHVFSKAKFYFWKGFLFLFLFFSGKGAKPREKRTTIYPNRKREEYYQEVESLLRNSTLIRGIWAEYPIINYSTIAQWQGSISFSPILKLGSVPSKRFLLVQDFFHFRNKRLTLARANNKKKIILPPLKDWYCTLTFGVPCFLSSFLSFCLY